MSDQKTILRSGQAGPIVKGTPDNVLTAVAGGEWQGKPASTGSTVSPIQNVRYLDPNSTAATPDGSIAAPWLTFADFWAEIVDANGWVLELPAFPVTVDAQMPDFNESPTVVLNGGDRLATVLDALDIATQSGNTNITLRTLTVLAITTGGINAPSAMTFDNCIVGSVSGAGTLQGTWRLLNCDVTDFTPGDFGPSTQMYGGSVNGNFRSENASFYNVNFTTGAQLRFGAHHIRFVGCKFGTGITIANNNNPTLELDPESYYWFVENGVTYTGTKLLTPVVPTIGHVINNDEDTIAGGGQSTIDFGNPVGGPLAEPGSDIIGCFAGDPGNVGFTLLGLTVDVGTGHVKALIGNNTAASHTLGSPVTINIVYVPRQSP